MSNLRCTFQAQAWSNDNCIEVDAEGETQWVVSDQEARRLTGFVGSWDRFVSDSFDGDNLLEPSNTPLWVQDWRGPFRIDVEETDDPPTEPEPQATTRPVLKGIAAAMDRCVAMPSEETRLIFEVLGGVKQALEGDARVLEAMPWSNSGN